MNKAKIYLCGPINGCTDEECNDWRAEVKKHFPNSIDPMRRDYRGREIDCVNEIVELDKKDVRACDVVLANCPTPSVGTSMEVLFAWEIGKHVVAVHPTDKKQSPWLMYHAAEVVSTVREAIEIIEERFAQCHQSQI